jgi:rare lipoprotein A
LRNQNTQRCSIKAALLTAALTGVFAAGVEIAPSLAKPSSPDVQTKSELNVRDAPAGDHGSANGDASFGDASFAEAYARGSRAHLRRAAHLGRAHHGGHSGARLTVFREHGKLRLVNADHGGGLSGIASVYHDPITANGEHMNPNAMTAAHKSLPMGSMVTVHNNRNGRSTTVRINDRGPYVTGRVIDLSPGAARVLGVDGLAPVSLTVNGRHVS